MKHLVVATGIALTTLLAGCVQIQSSQEATRYNFVTGLDRSGGLVGPGYHLDIPYVYELLVIDKGERTFTIPKTVRLADGARMSAKIVLRVSITDPDRYFAVFGMEHGGLASFAKGIAVDSVVGVLSRYGADAIIGTTPVSSIEGQALDMLTRSFEFTGLRFSSVSISSITFPDPRYADHAKQIGDVEARIVTNRARVAARLREIDDRVASERALRDGAIARANEEARRLAIESERDATVRIAEGTRAGITASAEARGVAGLRDGLPDDGSNLLLYEWSRMLAAKKFVTREPDKK